MKRSQLDINFQRSQVIYEDYCVPFTIVTRSINGHLYEYLHFRIGAQVHNVYLGKANAQQEEKRHRQASPVSS